MTAGLEGSDGAAAHATRPLGTAVDDVQERGRNAVIADRCDLASVALETVYSAALVESIDVPEVDPDALRTPVTRIFETGLAVGLALTRPLSPVRDA